MSPVAPSVFLSAAREILRPLEPFFVAKVNSGKIHVIVQKEGLFLHSKAVESYSLPSHVASLRTIAAWTKCVLHENLHNSTLHAKPQWQTVSQFEPKDFAADRDALAGLYKNNFVSAEKKEVIADLENSQGHYIRSALNPALRIFDAASQIASFNLGFNSTKRHALFLRPEHQTHLPLESTDLEVALGNLLKRESGLPEVYFMHSGSVANDFALSHLKTQHPKRSKIFAFEGSFHGRTLLALHATHSPAKREPFEIYPGIVDFFAFPETKSPADAVMEPNTWLKHWSSTTEDHTHPEFMKWLRLKDHVLTTEICVLEKIRKEFRSGNLPYALIIEPMQCEGGDRYATARFMRALRALTRAYEVPLIYDEVQCGLGLGGTFFWHTMFQLQTMSGEKDFPDVVTVAKKAQVGACLTHYQWPYVHSPSPAGLHRGYIQAQAALEGPEVDDLSPLALKCLEALANDTVSEWVLNSRGQGFAFAFDLPDPQIAADLIKVRFENGILIYPAGDRTLRFRLMVTTRRRDLFEMFVALYGCFESVASARKLTLKSELDSFKTTLQSILGLEDTDLSHKYIEAVVRDQAVLPKQVAELAKLDSLKWQKVFKTLMRLYPELVCESSYDLKTLKTTTDDSLVKRYQSEGNGFSWLQLLWELSRKHSFDVTVWSAHDIESYRPHIDKLQAATYEPARRSSVDDLLRQAEDPRTMALACIKNHSLAGMCIAVPLDTASDLPFFLNDGRAQASDLYSTDLTVDTNHRSNGLGLRLKVEQVIAARLGGYRRITSRNRYPEAKAMSRLNQKLGAVVCHISHQDYGGAGTGYYQSLELRRPEHPLQIFQNGSTLANKMCLSNFVSPTYLNLLEIWRETLPENYRHLYLSSGESEAVDKWIKTLFASRPKGKHALSFYGDHFGAGTASSLSLGGIRGRHTPWEWPRLNTTDAIKDFEKYLQKNKADEILGFFIEPHSKPFLEELMQICRLYKIPVIFNETRSMLGSSFKNLTFVTGSIKQNPDGFFAYGGNQIAINAVSDELFIAKPLTMISTWDGDEWSLQIFTERLLRFLETVESH